MFILNCNITFTNPDSGTTVRFDYVSDIDVATSINNFTDTAKITVPRKLKYKGKSITEFIKRNDSVNIEAGYGDSLETLFKGYVKSVSTGTPIIIECENESWKLKQIKLPATHFQSLNLRNFISEWMPSYRVSIADINLGEVRINEDTSLAKVFEYFQSTYPIRFYFRDDVFYGVLPQTMTLANDAVNTIILKIGYNTISDNLKYTLAEDVKLQVICKTIKKDNTKIEYKEPVDGDGCEVRTFLVPGADSVDDLKIFAKNQLETFKIDKMTGNITVFGQPFICKGDFIKLYDEDNKEQDNKKFICEAVRYQFGQSGYRQIITLGGQIHE